jgi:hypothetical protein
MDSHGASLDARNSDAKASLPPWILASATLLFLLTAGVYAFTVIFTKFSFYDDQGFIMITVQGYLSGHALYDSVFSVYGPVYYFYEWLIHTVTTLPVNHNVTGILCLVHWLSAAVILALAGVRLTRSVLFGFFVFMQAAVHLINLSGEPGHPQELVVLLLALASLVAAGGVQRRIELASLAAIGAALMFMKINVGAFYAMSIFLVFVCCNPPFRAPRALSWCVLTLCALLPFLLMRPRLEDPLVRDYAWRTFVTVFAVGVLAINFTAQDGKGHLRWLDASAAFGAVSAAILGVLLLTGTSLTAMWDCLVAIPAKNAAHWSIPLMAISGAPTDSAWPAAASLVVALLTLLSRKWIGRAPFVIPALKAIYGIAGSFLLVQKPTLQLYFLLPWIWLGLLPAKEAHSNTFGHFARTFICMLAAWQGLQAYPMGGPQCAYSTFLAILVYSLCLHDALALLAGSAFARRHLHGVSLRTGVLLQTMFLASLFYIFFTDWCQPLSRWRYYVSGTPLEPRGANLIRLSSWQAEGYGALTRYLQAESDTFLTVPGFNSLHFWTGTPPPTYFNVFERVCLGEREQKLIIEALRKAKRPLIVRAERRIVGSDYAMLGEGGPLARFITADCRLVTRLAGCEILTPKANGNQ